MFQIKNTKSLEKLFTFFFFIVVCAFSFSCAKKPSGVRAEKKIDSVNMNPAVSTQSEQQAQAQSLNYKIATLSVPKVVGTGFSIDSDLQNPDQQYLPITTSHEASNLYSEGSFNDSARGAKVYVQAQCFGQDCYKYLMMVTVVKNNQTVFQTAALSFKDDCKFYSISVAQGVATFFKSIQDLDDYANTRNYSPKNDCASVE